MTQTAIDLWNDKAFLKRRIREQTIYLAELQKRFPVLNEMTVDRKMELFETAFVIKRNLEKRLTQL